jgi:transposase
VVTIGIDPHKASHTAVALDPEGVTLGQLRVVADKSMLGRLCRWAAGWPQRVWAIEGAGGLGRLLAQQLVAAGETVIDVPSALAARARVLQSGHGRKTDGIDARNVAAVAQHRSDLQPVRADDHIAVLRLLSDRRDELTAERRRTINRLHRLLRDLRPGGAPAALRRSGRAPARRHPTVGRRRARAQGDRPAADRRRPSHRSRPP